MTDPFADHAGLGIRFSESGRTPITDDAKNIQCITINLQ